MPAMWGTSFDGVAVSGVVVELLRLARVHHERGLEVRIDLGYDIRVDKGRYGTPYGEERGLFPAWACLARVEGLESVPGYGPELVADVLEHHVRGGDESYRPRIAATAAVLAGRIVETWAREDVVCVVVENGTLPENPVYTEALVLAIAEYGARRGLGRYVVWRDHDLMWQSETASGRYGRWPYPAAVRPVESPHVFHAALHPPALRAMQAWAPGLRSIGVVPNGFALPSSPGGVARTDVRRRHAIPGTASVLARTTRIIAQKRIDRDIHLLAALPGRLDPHLLVAGDPAEDPATTAALRDLATSLAVGDRVHFTGPLAPVDDARATGATVGDLLAAADLVTFLTAYDYESFGKPIGEAVAAGVPFAASRFEFYDDVWGAGGFRGPLLDVRHHDLPDARFVAEVVRLLGDPAARADLVEHNRARAALTGATGPGTALAALVLDPLPSTARMAVVLPVFDEAKTVDGVLQGLADQRDDRGRLDPDLFEIVVVDNNSTDDTVARVEDFARLHPEMTLHVLREPEQGVSGARRTGLDFAATRARSVRGRADRFYLVSADADCRVDPFWLWELLQGLDAGGADLAVCRYDYDPAHFTGRPRLWQAIERTLRCRAVAFALFGGFPDGKGFAVATEAYDRAGGVELVYQLSGDRFVQHLSDDWDLGIKVAATGGVITYLPRARVEINPRRVDHALPEVVRGRAYGHGGTIVMRDIRPTADAPTADLDEADAALAWDYSVKDFVPKNLLLPVMLDPSRLDDPAVVEFFGPSLAHRLATRVAAVRAESGLVDYRPVHAYKTPSFRLYLEFRDELFACLRRAVGEDVGDPPELPECLATAPPGRFEQFARWFAEDRESGAAHDYFGNGGVF